MSDVACFDGGVMSPELISVRSVEGHYMDGTFSFVKDSLELYDCANGDATEATDEHTQRAVAFSFDSLEEIGAEKGISHIEMRESPRAALFESLTCMGIDVANFSPEKLAAMEDAFTIGSIRIDIMKRHRREEINTARGEFLKLALGFDDEQLVKLKKYQQDDRLPISENIVEAALGLHDIYGANVLKLYKRNPRTVFHKLDYFVRETDLIVDTFGASPVTLIEDCGNIYTRARLQRKKFDSLIAWLQSEGMSDIVKHRPEILEYSQEHIIARQEKYTAMGISKDALRKFPTLYLRKPEVIGRRILFIERLLQKTGILPEAVVETSIDQPKLVASLGNDKIKRLVRLIRDTANPEDWRQIADKFTRSPRCNNPIQAMMRIFVDVDIADIENRLVNDRAGNVFDVARTLKNEKQKSKNAA